MERKKLLAQTLLVLVSLILVSLIIFLVLRDKTISQKELKNELTKMGEDFYTTFYYDQISKDKTKAETKNYLEKFKDMGIKVSLTSLSQYKGNENDDVIAKFKNENDEQCDMEKTMVIIYPESPYNKTSYKITAVLKCNFNTSDK